MTGPWDPWAHVPPNEYLLNMESASTARFRVDGTGRVGIGKVPTKLLHMYANDATHGNEALIYFETEDDGHDGWQFGATDGVFRLNKTGTSTIFMTEASTKTSWYGEVAIRSEGKTGAHEFPLTVDIASGTTQECGFEVRQHDSGSSARMRLINSADSKYVRLGLDSDGKFAIEPYNSGYQQYFVLNQSGVAHFKKNVIFDENINKKGLIVQENNSNSGATWSTYTANKWIKFQIHFVATTGGTIVSSFAKFDLSADYPSDNNNRTSGELFCSWGHNNSNIYDFKTMWSGVANSSAPTVTLDAESVSSGSSSSLTIKVLFTHGINGGAWLNRVGGYTIPSHVTVTTG